MSKNKDLKSPLIIKILLAIIVTLSAIIVIQANNASKANAVYIKKDTWRQIQDCINRGGAIQRINPRECVIYKGVKGIDHSVNSFDDCAKGKAHSNINPPTCTTPDGRVFLGEITYP